MYLKKLCLIIVILAGATFISGCICTKGIVGEWASVNEAPAIFIFYEDGTLALYYHDETLQRWILSNQGIYSVDSSQTPWKITITVDTSSTYLPPGNAFGNTVTRIDKVTVAGVIDTSGNQIIIFTPPENTPRTFILRRLAK